ncbi:hypothetical protein [Mycolicibacterium porcinum]|uniref:PASTA domain-containing protein n=1 Tax=Mycolicibacterium porcinum TaxID=39693 RepID=A0ABV3VMY0_9MYCO
MTTTPSSADTVQEDRARTTEGPITFTRIPDPPNTATRGVRKHRILWGAMVTLAVIAVVLALVALSSRTVAVERPVSAPMLDRTIAEGIIVLGLKEGVGGARLRHAAGDPLPAQMRVSGEDACKLAGGSVILQSDPPACDVDVPTTVLGGVR